MLKQTQSTAQSTARFEALIYFGSEETLVKFVILDNMCTVEGIEGSDECFIERKFANEWSKAIVAFTTYVQLVCNFIEFFDNDYINLYGIWANGTQIMKPSDGYINEE